MSVKCTYCEADGCDLYLCRKCLSELRFMFGQIPWLWDELLTTRCRQDRISDDVGGRIRKTNQPINAFNVGAHQLSRELQDALQDWVVRLTEGGALQFLPALAVPTGFIGPLRPGWRRLPRGYGGEPPQQARWLAHHVNDIATRQDAGECYALFAEYVGHSSQQSHVGRLIRIINRQATEYVGPCYSVVGTNYQREPIYCRNPLHRFPGQETMICPKCGQEVDVKENGIKARNERDLQSESGLLEAMAISDEPISRNTLYQWLRDKRITVQGYEHAGAVVEQRVRKSDQRLFSVSQARALRAQDEHRRQRLATA